MVQNRKKARKQKSFGARLYAALYVLPLVLLAVLVLQRCQKNVQRASQIEKQTRELAEKYQSELERNDALQKESALVDTREYIVKEAKDKLGLSDPGEVLFKPER